MKDQIIFVTGYFGAPIREEARRIAAGEGRTVIDLDRAIEEKDGRSIARLCMMGGEHAYRNAEFEQVQDLCARARRARAEEGPGPVVFCGDGILYDEDSRKMILEHRLIIAGEDLPLDELWQRAKEETGTYHAFMKFGTEEEKRAAFEAHHARQQALFSEIRAGQAENA